MSDYTRAFAISASGMSLERLRLEVAALNLANTHATQTTNGRPYAPLRVTAAPISGRFDAMLTDRVDTLGLRGVNAVSVIPMDNAPRMEYDPGNPAADERGFVALPPVNPVEEMVTVMTSTRAYEANVRALNAAKAMALKALEIGEGK